MLRASGLAAEDRVDAAETALSLADFARAMTQEDPESLASSAAEPGAGGFDLFAGELDTLAWSHLGSSDPAARRPATRARTDLHRAGGPRTPIVDQLDQHALTDRQREVCSLAAAGGLTNREIAEQLGISKRTVENGLHRSHSELDRDG